jgi:hypothetical protein
MNVIYGFVPGHDPISLEPFNESSRIVEFKYRTGAVHYDYDTLRTYIKQITIVPHTGEPIDTHFQQEFNRVCHAFGDNPVFIFNSAGGNGHVVFSWIIGLLVYTYVIYHLVSNMYERAREIDYI